MQNSMENALFAPAFEPGINCSPFSIKFRYMPPWAAIFDYPDYAARDRPVILSGPAMTGWKMFAKFIKLPFRNKRCFHFFKPHREV